MNAQAQQTYLQTQINTASPGELTLLLFNGCLKFMKLAMEGIDKKDFQQKHLYIKRSQDIVEELLITLNMEYEISKNLAALYRFIIEKLTEANVHMNRDSLAFCQQMIGELRDTWVEALKLVKANGMKTG